MSLIAEMDMAATDRDTHRLGSGMAAFPVESQPIVKVTEAFGEARIAQGDLQDAREVCLPEPILVVEQLIDRRVEFSVCA